VTIFRREIGVVTKAEIHLRKGLKKGGINFEPQKTIRCRNGREYTVDLFVEERLVVEVDGWIHDLPDQQYQDKQRDKDLMESGYPVLRFRNWDIWQNLKGVVKDIRKALKENP